MKLSISERIHLAEDMWDSIAADPEFLPVTDAQKRVLDIRRETHSNDTDSTRSWEEIRADLDKEWMSIRIRFRREAFEAFPKAIL